MSQYGKLTLAGRRPAFRDWPGRCNRPAGHCFADAVNRGLGDRSYTCPDGATSNAFGVRACTCGALEIHALPSELEGRDGLGFLLGFIPASEAAEYAIP